MLEYAVEGLEFLGVPPGLRLTLRLTPGERLEIKRLEGVRRHVWVLDFSRQRIQQPIVMETQRSATGVGDNEYGLGRVIQMDLGEVDEIAGEVIDQIIAVGRYLVASQRNIIVGIDTKVVCVDEGFALADRIGAGRNVNDVVDRYEFRTPGIGP